MRNCRREILKELCIEGSNFRVHADHIIAAIGQRVDQNGLKGFDTYQDGTLRIDPGTIETRMKGVFAGGDVVTGPGWATDAIAAGKKTAASIHRYLSQQGKRMVKEYERRAERSSKRRTLSAKKRKEGFSPVEFGVV